MTLFSKFAKLTAAATFLLLIAGGLVTSMDAGLSVPDWPLSYGTLFPPMVGGIRFEHTHRIIAGVVAVLILILAAWLHFTEQRRWVRRLGYAALGGVIAQALLGGATVIYLLPPEISITHACLGQTVFCLVLSIAFVTSRTWDGLRVVATPDTKIARLSAILFGLVFAQLFLGAIVRHTGAAVWLHAGFAFVVATVSGIVLGRVKRAAQHIEPLVKLARFAMIGIGVQMLLGAAVWWFGRPWWLATAHVALGAAILGASCLMAWIAARVHHEEAAAAVARARSPAGARR